MKILVINAGSSSIKYQLIESGTQEALVKGLVERIGEKRAELKQQGRKKTIDVCTQIDDHEAAMKLVVEKMLADGALASMEDIDAVGHRVAHGGSYFTESVRIDEEVIEKLEMCAQLAPLHNPAIIRCIRAAKAVLPGHPMVAVFDTAFHQSVPPRAHIYAIPYKYYEEDGVRRYGFHGTSHKYVAQQAAEYLNRDIKTMKIVTCHLGNGASVAAVSGGVSIDTSMGMTPLEGLVMGTRSGDIDPAILPFICSKHGMTAGEAERMLNRESGLLGISGVSNDIRDLLAASAEGNERAQLALEVFAYRIRKYIGAYAAAMNGIDAIVFTAGIGENSPDIRKMVVEGLEFLGAMIVDVLNNTRGSVVISPSNTPVKVMVMNTNEELAIAQDTEKLLAKDGDEKSA